MIKIVEVGPRDGLQNEPEIVPTQIKASFVNALSATGVQEIEVSSFVAPKWVPQLSDAEEVFRRIERRPGIVYSALVPNEKGLERAQRAGVDKIAFFTAASETFNRRNINATIEESFDRLQAIKAGTELPLRAYVSTAFYCPYEGKIAPSQVKSVVQRLQEIGVSEITLGDTIGRASPSDVRELLDVLLPCETPLTLHLHATYGLAVASALTAWSEYGLTTFDASAGGLGGCPFAPGAQGNVATEDLAFAFEACGEKTGVDIEAVVRAAAAIEDHLRRPLASRLSRIVRAKEVAASRYQT